MKKCRVSGHLCLSFRVLCSIVALSAFAISARAADPYGNHDETTCSFVRGWACDADDFNAPVDIHFYADSPWPNGQFVGATTASVTRELAVKQVCGNATKNHGFSWRIPRSLKDNKWHTIYAHAINVGGGGNPLLNSTGQAILCPGKFTNLYVQPSVTSSSTIKNRTLYTSYGFPLPPPTNIPNGQLNVVFWRWNTNSPVSISSSLQSFTGVTVPSPLSHYQRGKSNTLGVTSVQWYGKTVGMLNIPSSSPHVGTIMPITVQQTFDPNKTNIRPWPNRQYELAYSVDVQIPYSSIAKDATNCEAINYAQSYLAVIDSKSKKWFWIGGTVYDSRPDFVPNGIYVEVDREMAPTIANPIVSSSYRPDMSYTHLDVNPIHYYTTNTPWSGFRTYHFRVSYGELQQAITDIQEIFPSHSSMSKDPRDFKLYGVFFLSEVYHGSCDRPAGALGLSVRNMLVQRVRNIASSY